MVVALQDIFQLPDPVSKVTVEIFHFLRFQVNVVEPDKQKRCQVFYFERMHVLRQQQKKGPFLIFKSILVDSVCARSFHDVDQLEESVLVGTDRTLIELLVLNLVWFKEVVYVHAPEYTEITSDRTTNVGCCVGDLRH